MKNAKLQGSISFKGSKERDAQHRCVDVPQLGKGVVFLSRDGFKSLLKRDWEGRNRSTTALP